jgi:transcriptional regulator with XRE-family HTH domain
MQVEAIRRIGEAIRERRVSAGFSQATFAEKADVDRQYLSRLERGLQNPSLLLLMRIALELDLTLVELLRDVRLDADELRSVKRLSRGPRPTCGGVEGE